MLLTAAALMAVIMAVSAIPAFASATKCQGNGCSFGAAVLQMATGEQTGLFNPPSGHSNTQGQLHAHEFGFGRFPPGR